MTVAAVVVGVPAAVLGAVLAAVLAGVRMPEVRAGTAGATEVRAVVD